MAEKAKKTAAKKAPAKKAEPKKNPVEALADAIAAAKKAGAQVHATIAWVDDDGNTVERSF